MECSRMNSTRSYWKVTRELIIGPSASDMTTKNSEPCRSLMLGWLSLTCVCTH
jgi:hypothetical protein